MFCCPGIDVGAIIEKLEQPPVIRNDRPVIGLFADTLPTFDFAASDYIGVVHFDADLHTAPPQQPSTMWGGPHLRPRCYEVFDEWQGFHGAGPDVHEQRAWRVFAEPTSLGWTFTVHGFQQWAVRIT